MLVQTTTDLLCRIQQFVHGRGDIYRRRSCRCRMFPQAHGRSWKCALKPAIHVLNRPLIALGLYKSSFGPHNLDHCKAWFFEGCSFIRESGADLAHLSPESGAGRLCTAHYLHSCIGVVCKGRASDHLSCATKKVIRHGSYSNVLVAAWQWQHGQSM